MENEMLLGSDHPQCSYYLTVYSISMQGVVARWLLSVTLDREVLGTGLDCHAVALCPWAHSVRLRMTYSDALAHLVCSIIIAVVVVIIIM